MRATLNRRQFLQTAGGGLAIALGNGCHSARPKAVTAPSAPTPLMDAHTHFYDPFRPEGVPWPPANDPLLYRTVMPADYRALPQPRPVTGTVVVEASPWVEDNQWVLELAAREPFLVGFVGNLPVGSPPFAGWLARFAANPIFRGLRLRGVNLPAALQRAEFVADLKRVADRGLSVDLVGGPEGLSAAKVLADTLPDLRVVIDHLAGVRIDGQAPPADWLAGMSRLAPCANVFCKVSGLVEGSGRRGGQAPRAVDFYTPVLEAMWERFGPARLLYASNWPVCEHFAPLATVQAIVSDYFQPKGQDAMDGVFRNNAQTVYRLQTRDRIGKRGEQF